MNNSTLPDDCIVQALSIVFATHEKMSTWSYLQDRSIDDLQYDDVLQTEYIELTNLEIMSLVKGLANTLHYFATLHGATFTK